MEVLEVGKNVWGIDDFELWPCKIRIPWVDTWIFFKEENSREPDSKNQSTRDGRMSVYILRNLSSQ